jgi:hypothetical protein
MTITSDHRGHICRSVVQKKRSRRFREGRGRFRLSTATCWRRARTSSEVSTPTAEEDADGVQECGDQMEHESTVVTSQTSPRRNGGTGPQVADLNTSEAFDYGQAVLARVSNAPPQISVMQCY